MKRPFLVLILLIEHAPSTAAVEVFRDGSKKSRVGIGPLNRLLLCLRRTSFPQPRRSAICIVPACLLLSIVGDDRTSRWSHAQSDWVPINFRWCNFAAAGGIWVVLRDHQIRLFLLIISSLALAASSCKQQNKHFFASLLGAFGAARPLTP